MDDAAAEAEALRLRLAAVARKWLEDPRADSAGNITHAASQKGHALNSLVLAGARISLSEHGRVVCSFQVPPPLTVRAPSSLAYIGFSSAHAYYG
uniref:Uncharacterized protein n=2 Tax=Aegilops tauschii subsp. strangulata TaxID=200361 RepID=A0A453EHX4_AEGTS